MFVCGGEDMSRILTRKVKYHTSRNLIPVSIPESYTISNTNKHEGREHYRNYVEILAMFENKIFISDDLYIEAYKNIRKRGIHTIATLPKLFPYNDASKWCFAYLQKDSELLLNASGLPIASLKADDIGTRYQPP
jgi:hypothetical protein